MAEFTLDDINSVEPIELDASNLYNNASQIVFSNGDGILQRDQIDYTPREGDQYHTVRYTDNLYKIAYQYYKDVVSIPSRWWWVIADVNKDVIFNPLDLSDLVGDEILIPNLTNFRLITS